MHPENNKQEDFLDDEYLRELSEKLIGVSKRKEIIDDLKSNSPYRDIEKSSLRVKRRKSRYAFLLAAAVLLTLFVGRKFLYPEPAEEIQDSGLVACLDAVDRPLALMALDRDRGESTKIPEVKLAELAAQNYIKEDYVTALALYEEAIEEDPLNALYLLCKAHCQARLERYTAAIETFDRALERSRVEENGDLVYTSRFYRAITRLRIEETDPEAVNELQSLANRSGYFQDEAAKVLSKL
ncbi:hypothetical protein CEQ90_15220 [Lewinellaceae bacterium SD302]|nr:hypothetical protein CEQ90_15220 [Lewinellaceae bacterium SD302]